MPQDDETRVIATSGSQDHDALVCSVLAERYEIEELLSVGAMYLGRILKVTRRDAIKGLHPDQDRDPDANACIHRGARNVGAIRHPNVSTSYDFSETDSGLQYLAVEDVAGESLKEVMDREPANPPASPGTLPLERVLRIADQVAAALQAAQEADIVHRDLSPGNIMIVPGHAGEDAVKVEDFDLSKGSRAGIDPEVTRVGFGGACRSI
ncbi:MAG: protein kinase [Gemmatimonadota bacterium]